jgi:hypothetical protein
MEKEKKYLLKKINQLIDDKKERLLNKLPSVHEVEDGIIIRFFTQWDNCEDDNKIKFKKVINVDNPDESIVFFYLPKDSIFDLKQRFFIGCMVCLNGKIDVVYNDETRHLEGYTKICIDSDEVQGFAKENTYLMTTSYKSQWSENTKEHVKEVHGY